MATRALTNGAARAGQDLAGSWQIWLYDNG